MFDGCSSSAHVRATQISYGWVRGLPGVNAQQGRLGKSFWQLGILEPDVIA